MTNGLPFFSVVIPTHNRPDLLDQAALSVANQSFKDLELIVVNDGSDLAYDSVIDQYTQVIDQYLVNEKPEGASAARNKGVAHAKGKWVVFLDDDDRFHPNYLFDLHQKLEGLGQQNKVFIWANVRTIYFDCHGFPEKIEVSQFDKDLNNKKNHKIIATMAATSYGLCLERRSFLELDGFDKSFSVGEDTEFIIRMMRAGYEPQVVANIGIIKNNHFSGRLSSSTSPYSTKKIYERILEKHADYIGQDKHLLSSLLQYSAYIHFDNGDFDSGSLALKNTLQPQLISWSNILRYLFLTRIRRMKQHELNTVIE